MARLILAVTGWIVACGLVAWAQPAASVASRLAWDQPAGTLAEASGYNYEASWDGAAAVAVAGVTCAGASSPFVCAGTFPALTPAGHTVRLQARNAAGASPLSASFAFTFVALPQAPQNLRILPTP